MKTAEQLLKEAHFLITRSMDMSLVMDWLVRHEEYQIASAQNESPPTYDPDSDIV